MARRLFLAVMLILLGAGGAMLAHHFRRKPALPIVKQIVVSQPSSQPTTHRAVKLKYPSYMEVIRMQNPTVAATQPLDYPLDLPDSAHLILHDPTYLDSIGNLWITRMDGEPTAKALLTAADSEEHIITDQPVFVHWWWVPEAGKWSAAVIVRSDKGGYDLITKTSRSHLPVDRLYRWSSAFSILGKIVVCTDVGVCVFDIDPDISEHYHLLPGCDSKTNPPVTILDTRGVLAWSPWENGKPGSNGVSRFVDGSWMDLAPVDWPARLIQLSMLLDGSVLRIAAGSPPTTAPAKAIEGAEGVEDAGAGDQFADQIHLSIGQLETPGFDQKRLNDLIKQLSDTDEAVRQSAFDELSRYGPEIAPVLEKAATNQLPVVRNHINQLLRNKITPALGGLSVVDSRLDVVKRCADGTVIFYAPSGVKIPSERGDDDDLVTPAWLALRADGRMEHPLPPALVGDQKPSACTLLALRDDWIVNDEAGPRRLVGSSFEPLLAPAEKQFDEIVGTGTRHRWVFRESRANGNTLIIDPGVADPTAKLPTWVIATPRGSAGWDAANFPAVSRAEQGGDWELNDGGWKALDKNEKVITAMPHAAQPTAQSSTQPSTQSSTQPTTSIVTENLGKPILFTADGTRYFDGKTSLIMLLKNGEQTSWPLPPAAMGTADPVLIETADGLLFLFNQGGRLLRIRSTPGKAEPFQLEATFTRDIPNTDNPARIWLDPAGRIDFVSDENVLTLSFPGGRIPKEITRMMLDQKH